MWIKENLFHLAIWYLCWKKSDTLKIQQYLFYFQCSYYVTHKCIFSTGSEIFSSLWKIYEMSIRERIRHSTLQGSYAVSSHCVSWSFIYSLVYTPRFITYSSRSVQAYQRLYKDQRQNEHWIIQDLKKSWEIICYSCGE